jgi:hypothetical protein
MDQLALIRRAARLRACRRGVFDAADAELRRLIREGFEHGIPSEQLAEADGRCVRPRGASCPHFAHTCPPNYLFESELL